jgi:hypothetical protein
MFAYDGETAQVRESLVGWSDHERLLLAASNAVVLRKTMRDGGGLAVTR